MRDALIEILERQVVTPQRAAIELTGFLDRRVSVFEARSALESMAEDGLAKQIPGKKGLPLYSGPSGGGDRPGGSAA